MWWKQQNFHRATYKQICLLLSFNFNFLKLPTDDSAPLALALGR